MSSAAVFERRNKLVQDALDGGNLKQALQLCEKRIKKGENSALLLAWRANILCAHRDAASFQRGMKETLELVNAEPPVTDLDTIQLLCENLRLDETHSALVQTVWERAARAKPRELELQLRWFSTAMDQRDWRNAQKAAMSLQRNFPDNRAYYFWAVFTAHLVAVDTESSAQDRQLFGTLAYRMIAKAASLVPAGGKDVASQPRAIQTAEELLLLVKVFEAQGRFVEIAETLGSPALGMESAVTQGDWTFTQERIRSLEKAKLWEDLLETAKGLLALPEKDGQVTVFNPEERDDWVVWQGLLKATEEQLPSTLQSSMKFVEGLAELGAQKGLLQESELMEHCERYFREKRHKLYCFTDLREVLSRLTSTCQSTFFTHLQSQSRTSTESDGIPAINVLKLSYLLGFSLGMQGAESADDFAASCLALSAALEKPAQGHGVIESQPRDDLCVMAAMAIIRYADGDSSDTAGTADAALRPRLVQAAAILECLLASSPHNYEALLLLTRIYLLLGAGSLAMQTFAKLNVKQMQYESVAHNLFARLATIHPAPAPAVEGLEQKDVDPQLALRHALDFYRRSERATASATLKGLQCGSYVNTQGCISLQAKLTSSLCRRVWALEERRCNRLLGGNPTSQFNDIAFDSSEVTDQRSYEGFMNLEAPDKPSFEEFVRVGPTVGTAALRAMSLTDTLLYLLAGPKTSPGAKNQPNPSSFESYAAQSCADQLTSAEADNAGIQAVLLRGAVALANGKSGAAVVQTAVEACGTWVTQKLAQITADEFIPSLALRISESQSVPTWRYMHDTITCLETLSAAHIFLRRAHKSKSITVPQSDLDTLERGLAQLAEAIRKKTAILRSTVAGPETVTALESSCHRGSGALQKALDRVLTAASLRKFAQRLRESWLEALDGVTSVAIL
ncbi:hypothetical protein KEM52_000582 [Ascosphaera acerosa]|nr:hypothetical protein KEM52_000582 [Ascosphaera acerosa]